MSRENVGVVREAIRRFTAGDMEGVSELYSEDALAVAPEGWPEAGRFEGRDAVIRQFRRLAEDWERQSMEVDEEKTGDDWVVLKQVWGAQGAGSGVPLQMTLFGAYRLESGKIAEARFFWERADALEAVGLRD